MGRRVAVRHEPPAAVLAQVRAARAAFLVKRSVSEEQMTRWADWKGALRRRWSWRRWRFEWGRYCFRTNAFGDTLESWWEPESRESGASNA